MSLPPHLEFGPHRLQLMTVSRNADDVIDARRCSDHALTAFCYVGELQDAASATSILWYYSPLFQFERKKIRVEESVIAAALSKAVSQRTHAGITVGVSGGHINSSSNSNISRRVFVDAASVASSAPDAPLAVEPDRESTTREAGRRISIPGIFIRLGKSTTFREYKLLATDVQAEVKSVTTAVEEKKEDETGNESSANEEQQAAAPLLTPAVPQRPSMTLQTYRFGSFSLRRRPTLRRDGVNNFMTVAVASSAPNTTDEGTATGRRDTDSDPSSGNEVEDDDALEMSTATAPAGPHTSQAPSSVVRVPQCDSPDPSARKSVLTGPAWSSLSSAFLSTSNCPSGRVSRLPTSGMSTARSPGVELDVRPSSSSHNAYGDSARDSEEIPMLLREPLLATAAVTAADAPSPPMPTPPSSQRVRTARRPLLRTQVSRAHSDYAGQLAAAQDSRTGLNKTRAVTPPVMHAL